MVGEPRQWVCVARTPERGPVAEAGFVLTAVGIDNLLHASVDEWQLWVPRPLAASALDELTRYEEDRRAAQTAPADLDSVDRGGLGIAGFLLAIWLVPMLQGYGLITRDTLLEAGRLQAGATLAGEWWRPFTALTLHADLGHIVGNSVFGVVVGLMLARRLGSGIGWLLVLLSGAAGNGINAWLQATAFAAIGASTATFAGLGLVGAFAWQREGHRAFGLRRSLAPLFAAFALLAFTGTGGENTDVLGHICGFAAGATLGLAASALHPERASRRFHYGAGALALGLLAGAWWLALNAL